MSCIQRAVVSIQGFMHFCSDIARGASCHDAGSVADKMAISILRMNRKTVLLQHCIHAAGDIRQGIDQRSVQIKQYDFPAQRFHLIPIIYNLS